MNLIVRFCADGVEIGTTTPNIGLIDNGDGTYTLSGEDFDKGRRVVRGGAWDGIPRLLRCAWRDGLPRNRRQDNLGFRLVCDIDG